MKAIFNKSITLWLGLAVSIFLGMTTNALAYPAIDSSDNTFEWITNVSFNTIDNTQVSPVPAQDPGGYGDYTAMTTTVTPGSPYTLSVTIDPDTGDKISAFFDWDHSNSFDPGEEVEVTPTTIQTPDSTFTASVVVNIPATATLGDTIMRIVLSGALLDSDPVQSSGTLTFGEAEDYTISILNPGNSLNPIITATNGLNGTIAPAGAVIVTSGTDQVFTITPDLGFFIDDVIVDGISVGPGASYTFFTVVANHTIHATFSSIINHTITATAGLNGSINPAGAVRVSNGSSQIFTILAATGYKVADVLVDGGSVGAVSSYTFANVLADHIIAASFSLDGYPAISSSNFSKEWITNVTFGSINNSSNAEGYASFLDLSTEVQQGGEYPISITIHPQADENITVFIDWNQNNDFTDLGEKTVIATLSLAAGPHIVQIPVPVGATLGTTRMRVVLRFFETAMSAGDIGASASGGEAEDYTIVVASPTPATIATATGPGTIDPPGTQPLAAGGSLLYTITPDLDNFIQDILVDGVPLQGPFLPLPYEYTFNNVIVTHTIHAAFVAIPIHTITATSGPNGTISPTGAIAVVEGNNQVFTITPDEGYLVEDVVIDSASVGAVIAYTFPTVTTDHSITATFSLIPPVIEPFPWTMFMPAITKNRAP